MNPTIDPSTIIQKVKAGQISKSEAIKIFDSILNESESEIERKEAITSIGSMAFNTNSIYKLLEKSMISDESPIVRVEAAKVLLNSYDNLNLTPIIWAIENENSILFFKHLLDFFELNPQLTLKNQVINKLTKIYNLAYNDLRFIIDLDYLETIKFLNQYQDFINKFEVQQAYQRDLLLQNTSLNNKGLSRIDKTVDGHIIHLTLHDLELIPSSINLLPKLEKLKIDHCNFKGVNLNNLSLDGLKQLTFSNNQMDKVPKWVWIVANKKRHVKNFIKNGVVVSQAATLALLEILCEKSLNPIKRFEQPLLNSAHFYKLDEIGRVIGIFIANLPSKIGIFPNQICNLRYLEELHLVNQNIGELPDGLIKLKKLKILNLSNNHITSLPENFEFMRNLEYIDLHVDEKEKEIFQIPDSLKNLHNLKILDLRGKVTKILPDSM
jgi:Leucine-rich repeat (LRR) protein